MDRGFEAGRDKQGEDGENTTLYLRSAHWVFFTSPLLLSVFFFDKHRRGFSTSYSVSGVCPLGLCLGFFLPGDHFSLFVRVPTLR